MSRAIDRITAHYAATKGKRHCIKSPVWGLDVWFGPWTLGEKDRAFGTGGAYRHRDAARVLVVKAEDENGAPLFSEVEERELLNEADPDEIHRVANAIMAKLREDIEAAAQSNGGAAPKA